MNILFTLCGRAGSKGLKNKNLKTFRGVPLAYYSIAAILLFIKSDTVRRHNIKAVLNTDSEELIRIIQRQDKVHFEIIKRNVALSGDTVPKVTVIYDCLNQMEIKTNLKFDMVVDLDITSPLRTLKDIQNAIAKKIERNDVDAVYSVTESRRNPYFNMVKREGEYFEKVIPCACTSRQQATEIYDMNASIYVYSVKALQHKKHDVFFNDKCDIVVMKDTGILDIDSEEDFEMMQVIAGYLFQKDEGLGKIYNTAREILNSCNYNLENMELSHKYKLP